MTALTLGLSLLAVTGPLAFGFPNFKDFLPNGEGVPSPCDRDSLWIAFAHVLPPGPGAVNRFGDDMAKSHNKWTTELCQADSDGDGKTNGEELGDPDCVWKQGDRPQITDPAQLSHPGVCEPVDSELCRGSPANDHLRDIEACKALMNVTADIDCPAIADSDVESLELRFSEFTLPPKETSYMCQTLQVPDDKEYHVIAFEPIVMNTQSVHHLALFVCDSVEAEQAIASSGNYKLPTECTPGPRECPNATLFWSFGTRGRCFNENAGLAMGKNSYRTVVLQVNFNNAWFQADITDSSGIKLYYTPRLRPNNLGLLRLGQRDISIPPRSHSTRISSRAFHSAECSQQTLASHDSYTVAGVGFLMHRQGLHGKVTLQKADGSEVSLMDDMYNYDLPTLVTWPPDRPVRLEPGDNVRVECGYQTLNRRNWTFYGPSHADEECTAYVEVFPRPQQANFVDVLSQGSLDRCRQRAGESCGDSGETNATAGDLTSACLEASSAACCSFLRRTTNVASNRCVHKAAYDVIKQVLLDTAAGVAANDVARIHSRMVRCARPVAPSAAGRTAPPQLLLLLTVSVFFFSS